MNRRNALVAMCTTAVLAVPAAASAAPVTDSFYAPVASAATDLGSYHVQGTEPYQQTWYNLDVSANATWSGSFLTSLGWNTTNVRQGAPLSVSRADPLRSGKLRVSWKLDGALVIGPVETDVHKTLAKNASCAPQVIGGGYDCVATSPPQYLVRTVGVINGIYSKLRFKATFTVTPEGAIVTRRVSMDGAPASPTADLSLSMLPQLDAVKIPCGPVGNDVSYALAPFHWTPDVTVTQVAHLEAGLMDPVLGDVELPAVYDEDVGPVTTSHPAFDLSGTGHTTDLGPALPNNVAPTISNVGNLTGKVGVPVHFWTVTSSRCPLSTYEWKFSNGGTNFGAAPQRTFAKPGVYDAQVTVKDQTGLAATKQFAVTISQ